LPIKPCGSIRGVLRGEDGLPVADANVLIEDGDQSHPDLAIITDDHGKFEIHELLPGKYLVVAYAATGGRAQGRATVEAGNATQMSLLIEQD